MADFFLSDFDLPLEEMGLKLIRYADYFLVLAGWPGRVKHPATDPINALLSFGYTLMTNELAATIEMLGLDSYLGCLHQLDYGRQSLALDLVELFRAPLVDRLVLTVLNRREFVHDDFEKGEGGGMYLVTAAAKRFLGEYERWMLHEPAGGESHRISHGVARRRSQLCRGIAQLRPGGV